MTVRSRVLCPKYWAPPLLGLLVALTPPSGFAATFVVDDATDAVSRRRRNLRH